MKKKYRYLIIFILSAFAASGCATGRQIHEDTLTRLYAKQRNVPKKNPVIFIHGILGSVLKDPKTGRIIWGGVFEGSMQKLALPIESKTLSKDHDELVPVKVMERFSWFGGLLEKDIYGVVERVAIKAGGYVLNQDAFILVYDWRRDLVETAKQLDEFIEEIKQRLGKPNLKFTLMCHSMGGLVARYYVKYGGVDVLDEDLLPLPSYAGARNINKVIMLGTPNCGSLEAFQRLHRGLYIPGVGHTAAETIFTLPSLYELLPPEGEPVFVDSKGKPQLVDLYDPENWEKYGWSAFNPIHQKKMRQKFLRRYGKKQGEILYFEQLEKQRRFLNVVLNRARKFHEALWQGDPEEEKRYVTYALLGADSLPTLQRAMLEETPSGWQTKFRPNNKNIFNILYGFGDGSVTKDSLLGIHHAASKQTGFKKLRLPSAYEVFIAEKHVGLADNLTYLDNVLHMLLD